jgi:uncharacterized Tic20 family protein
MSEGYDPNRNPTAEEPISTGTGEFVDKDARLWGMLCHLSALSVFLTGVGLWLGPLICWLVKRNDSPFIDDQGKESVNFQISMFIYSLVAGVLVFCFGIGVFIALGLFVVNIVFVIIASMKANDGIRYRYPLTIRLIS